MVKEFWEEAHRLQKLDNLTGSPAIGEIEQLHINLLIKDPILVIGVGVGNSCKYYNNLGLRCDALDISDIALSNVKDYTFETFNHSDLLPKNKYNLVQSWLVSQHINDYDFELQMYNAIRSLTNEGVYALQYIFWYKNIPINVSDNDKTRGGSHSRTPQDIKRIIESNNGKIVWQSLEFQSSHPDIKSCIVHIMRNKNE